MKSRSAASRLARLRLLLTIVLASVAAIGLSVLAVVATLVDGSLRADDAATYRQGLASRLAALIYPDEDGVWIAEGVIDDRAAVAADAVIVATRDGAVLHRQGDISGFEDLLTLGLADEAEVGAVGIVSVGSESQPAAAAPFWDFETVEGAVIVALADSNSGEHRRLRFLVWSSALGLTLASAGLAWWLAGRVVAPVAAALEREERFLATAAHDIRTPLGRVQALAESALRTWSQQHETGQAAASSAQLGEELRRLVIVAGQTSESANDLLLAGRIDADQLELRRERLRLDRLVAAFEDTIPELTVETFEAIEIQGDKVLVQHAVGNLLSNAVKHGRSVTGRALIRASVRSEGSDAVVAVADEGPGLRNIDPDQIFNRFQQAGSSSGLGLWIVKTIMYEHDGVVDVYANQPTGVIVELRFPVIPRP